MPSRAWRAHPAIEVLGNLDAERLSIVSFVVRRPGGRYLHHNFVVALLNDLFGIQSRGGCSCAGPYGHRLLGIDLERSHEFEREIAARLRGHQAGLGARQLQLLHLRSRVPLRRRGRRPGRRTRAGDSARLRFDPATGLWHHRDGPVEPPLRLTDVTYPDGVMTYPRTHVTADESILEQHWPTPERFSPPASIRRRVPRVASAPTSKDSAGSTCRRSACPDVRSERRETTFAPAVRR